LLTTRNWRRGPTASSSCATATWSTRRRRRPVPNRSSNPYHDHDPNGLMSIGVMLGRSSGARPPNGGVPARRAVARWAWRLFRREWRQQALVLALLTVAIAAVIFGATAAYDMIPSHNGDFGTADVRVQLTVSDPVTLRDDIAALTKTFGTVDVRTQDPHGPYGAAMLALRAGRYPSRAGEVAITDRVAELFHARVGHA